MEDAWCNVLHAGTHHGSETRQRMSMVCTWANRLALCISRKLSEFPLLYDLSKVELTSQLRFRAGLLSRISNGVDQHLMARVGLKRRRKQDTWCILNWDTPGEFTASINYTIQTWLDEKKESLCLSYLRGAGENFLNALDVVCFVRLILAGFAIYISHNARTINLVACCSAMIKAADNEDKFMSFVNANNATCAVATACVLQKDNLLEHTLRRFVNTSEYLTVACKTGNAYLLRYLQNAGCTWMSLDLVYLYRVSRPLFCEMFTSVGVLQRNSMVLYSIVASKGDIEVMGWLLQDNLVTPSTFLGEVCSHYQCESMMWLIAQGATYCANCLGRLDHTFPCL